MDPADPLSDIPILPPAMPVLNYAAPPGMGLPTQPAPPYKLFSVSSITLATFLGSPLGGALLMAINYHRLGRKRTARAAVLWGVLGTALLCVAAFLTPDRLGMILGLGSLVAMNAVAKYFQGETLLHHDQQRGQAASSWAAAGIGLACLALVVGLLFAGVLIQTAIADSRKINYSAVEEIRYSGQANPSDARKLGDLLKQTQFFNGTHPKTVLIDKDKSGTSVSFVLGQGKWDDPAILAAFHHIGDGLALSLGKPLTIKLCDAELTVKKEIPIK